MKKLNLTLTGTKDIRLNNPQAADPLNKFAKAMKVYTSVHTSRRDEKHYTEQRELEIASKVYYNDELGVYIPTSWIMEAICKVSFKMIKVAKAEVRSAIFLSKDKLKLNYRGEDTVKSVDDIIKRDEFKMVQLMKQGQVKIAKAFPQFRDWSVELELFFDESIFIEDEMKRMFERIAKYNGLGDFRPTYGLCEITNWEVTDA